MVAGLDSVTEAVAVGFVFLPSDSDQQVSQAVEILQSATEEFGMKVFGWRDVPGQSEVSWGQSPFYDAIHETDPCG